MITTIEQLDRTLESTGNQTAVDIANSYGSNSFAWDPGAPGQGE